MPNVTELTHEEVREALLEVSPATLEVVAKDIQWMMTRPDMFPKFDLKQQSLGLWVSDCIKRGATYHRDAMERKIEAKKNEAEANEKAQNLEAFAKFIITQPDILKDLPRLIAAAIPFKVPIDLLMNYYNRNQAPPAAAAQPPAAK